MAFQLFSDRRNTHRVYYESDSSRPRVILPQGEFQIADMAERSFRFICKRHKDFAVDQPFSAEVLFSTGESIFVEGKIYRKDRENIVVNLSEPIPGHLLLGLGIDRRAYFRLRYPLSEHPRLQINDQQGKVREISENGARLVGTGIDESMIGESFSAIITFHDHEAVEVSGKVMRIDPGDIPVMLFHGIPESRIMKEQLYLMKRYRDML